MVTWTRKRSHALSFFIIGHSCCPIISLLFDSVPITYPLWRNLKRETEYKLKTLKCMSRNVISKWVFATPRICPAILRDKLNYEHIRKFILVKKNRHTHVFLRGEWDVSWSQEHVSVGVIMKRLGGSELLCKACGCLLCGSVSWLWCWALGEQIYLKTYKWEEFKEDDECCYVQTLFLTNSRMTPVWRMKREWKRQGRHPRELTYENSGRPEIIIYLEYLELKPSEPQKGNNAI